MIASQALDGSAMQPAVVQGIIWGCLALGAFLFGYINGMFSCRSLKGSGGGSKPLDNNVWDSMDWAGIFTFLCCPCPTSAAIFIFLIATTLRPPRHATILPEALAGSRALGGELGIRRARSTH